MEISRTYPSVEIEGKNFDDFKNEWRIWVNSYFF